MDNCSASVNNLRIAIPDLEHLCGVAAGEITSCSLVLSPSHATSGVPTWFALQHRLDKPWPRKFIQFAMTGWTEKSSLWFGPDDGKEMC